MTHDSDYGYIQVFINYLKQILEMIMGLFKGGATEGEGEDKLFYVMAKELYGTGYIDGSQKGRWNDELTSTIPYVLTNQMAFGVSSGNITKSLHSIL